MKFSTAVVFAAAVYSGSTASASSDSISNGLPPNHPVPKSYNLHPSIAKFSGQLRCPYAHEWLAKGAHQAAVDLGLTTPEKVEANKHNSRFETDNRSRKLQESATVMGSCSFNNPWSGPSCMEFRGDGWTQDSMIERCDTESESILNTNEPCQTNSGLAGWCIKESSTASNAFEATSMMITSMSDCGGNKMACETFVGGTFTAAGSCTEGAQDNEAEPPTMGGSMMGGGFDLGSVGGGPPASEGGAAGTCLIAPGAIGAAHQAGFSNGYSSTCPGTPGEGSPYMWPLAWSANIDTQTMPYGTDDVMYHSKGRVFYRLDKNWKRADTTFAQGILRTIGQGPCEDIDESFSQDGLRGCNENSDFSKGDPLTTMIHRGSKMYFITWTNSSDVKVGETDPSLIEECTHLDLMVIGNIRPDWFLDARGDDTDVQYLGDQHVYYADANLPKLVKQWRKKDFASQYFTMSVMGNPPNRMLMKNSTSPTFDKDSIHWPLILNVPGEGFGDDMLQSYKDHTILTDDDDDLFLLIENLETMGGSCPLVTSGFGDGETVVGPPTLDVHVPSDLEVDPNSWFSNEYTFSPVWKPPMKEKEASSVATEELTGIAVTEEGRIKVESCYDPSAGAVQISMEWLDIVPIATESGNKLPWMSLGYRAGELCAMNPPDGSDTQIVMINQSPEQVYPKAYAGSLQAGAKRLDSEAIGSVYESFWPLEKTIGYSEVSLAAPMIGLVLGDDVSSVIGRSAPSDTSVRLSFKQEVEEVPDVMHLMYAIGMRPELGVHVSRGCFDVDKFPICPQSGGNSVSDVETKPTTEAITSLKTEEAVVSAANKNWSSIVFCVMAVASIMSSFLMSL